MSLLSGIGSALGWGSKILGLGGDLLSFGDADKTRAQAQGQFDAQMDQTIQRRVADARKAGVHPLFALGASAGASPTTAAGQPRRPTSAGTHTPNQALVRSQVAANNARATADAALAAKYDSEAAVNRQHTQGTGLDGDALGVQTTPEGVIDLQPVQVPTRHKTRRGTQAGKQPSTMRVEMPSGVTLDLPVTDEIAEAFSAEQIVPYYSLKGYTDMFTYLPKWFKAEIAALKSRSRRMEADAKLRKRLRR